MGLWILLYKEDGVRKWIKGLNREDLEKHVDELGIDKREVEYIEPIREREDLLAEIQRLKEKLKQIARLCDSLTLGKQE